MAFEFIDNGAGIGLGARKRIRSHVMRGKNIGKVRTPKSTPSSSSQLPSSVLARQLPSVSVETESLILPSQYARNYVLVARQFCHELSSIPFPSTLSPRALSLVHKFFGAVNDALYPPNVCRQPELSGNLWARYVFSDAAYFHCTVATSVTCCAFFSAPQPMPREAMQHLAHTFRLTNQKLSGPAGIADETIAVVIGLVICERLLGNDNKAYLHFEGLQRMVMLRGGVSKLLTNPPLSQKFLRSDIDFAIQYGTRTVTPLQDIPGQELIDQIRDATSPALEAHFRVLPFLRTVSPELKGLFVDALSVSTLVNGIKTPGDKLDANDFQSTVIRLHARAVNLYPLQDARPGNLWEDFLHIGLLAFVGSFWHEFAGKARMTPLLTQLIREMTDRGPVESRSEDHNSLIFWILAVGRMCVLSEADDTWFSSRYRKIAVALGLSSWHDAQKKVRRFPWLNTLHDRRGENTWEFSLAMHLRKPLLPRPSLSMAERPD